MTTHAHTINCVRCDQILATSRKELFQALQVAIAWSGALKKPDMEQVKKDD